ncbi:MAG: (2Fe-2S)-binding protein [Deltaproteobacteria bacterium]|nr:MAG: (2Fe-2S)-binding protein [Deltaproteobacteria bacterium]
MAYHRGVERATAEVPITFLPSGIVRYVPAGTRLFDAVQQAGLPMATACQAEGICGFCRLEILAGEAHLSPPTKQEADTKRRNEVPQTARLACLTTVHGPVTVRASYW